MKEDSVFFIGLDMSKPEISVTLADGARNGEVRFLGDISSELGSAASMVNKPSKRGANSTFAGRSPDEQPAHESMPAVV